MQYATNAVKPEVLSARAREVVEWFGLFDWEIARETQKPAESVVARSIPAIGNITLITGGSGSGKSTLLRAVAEKAGPRAIQVDVSAIGPGRVVELFGDEPVEAVVSRLAWAGLGEPAVLLRPAAVLSDGERFRLALCLAIRDAEKRPGPVVLVCDEFASTLDDGCAVACASTLRRAVNGALRLSAVVATWREELGEYLKPEVVVRCDYGLWEVSGG